MICMHCDRENEDGRKFCIYCGYPIDNKEENIGFSRPDTHYIGPKVIDLQEKEAVYPEDGEEVPMPKTPYGNQKQDYRPVKVHSLNCKSLFIGILSVVIIIIAVSILYWNVHRDTEAFQYITEDALEVFIDRRNNRTIIFNTKGDKLFDIDEASHVLYTQDGTAAILYNQYANHFYYVNAKELIKLRDNINGINFSDDGNYLAYCTFNSSDTINNCLYWYDAKNKKEVVLDQGKVFINPKLSPDGKSLVYRVKKDMDFTNFEDGESYLIRNGGEPEFLGENRMVLALSNNAEHIFYYEIKDNNFFFYLKKDGHSLYLSGSLGYLMFNLDCSEVLFSDDESTYLWSENCNKIKIYDSFPRELILPNRCITYGFEGIRSGIRAFENKALVFQDNSVIWIGEGYETTKIGDNAGHYFAVHSNKDDTIMFGARDLKIKKVTLLSELHDTQTYINRADNIVASDDLSYIYYIDKTQLYYKNGQEESIMLADNVKDVCLSANGDIAFFLKDDSRTYKGSGELYYSLHGSEPMLVDDGHEVTWIGRWSYGIVYGKEVGEDRYDIYYNTKGSEFKRILENVHYNDMMYSGIHHNDY
ncbi:MAG: zinc-ribbon domain-containing protein [Clostridiales bacterium]|nr:zinc-ribbon domain-containing protein [Clostridiales bacterium]